MLLDWRGRRDGRESLIAAAAQITAAVDRVLDNPRARTRDVGGQLDTTAFTRVVCAAIREG
jgi:3-isopropylmalate dehydrogenase